MVISGPELLRAMELFVGLAYPGGTPGAVAAKVEAVRALGPIAIAEDSLKGILEKNDVHATGWAVRLGQPLYPHMKLAIDPLSSGEGHVFRVDAHDRHLHAPAGSPDEAWLSQVRKSNQALVERIETAWEGEHIPTFRGVLRSQLAQRRARQQP
jgi:hypothetical protein